MSSFFQSFDKCHFVSVAYIIPAIDKQAKSHIAVAPIMQLRTCVTKILHIKENNTMGGSRKFCQRVSNFFFSLMRGGRIQIPLLAGHQRPTSKMPFKWRFAGGQMMAQH